MKLKIPEDLLSKSEKEIKELILEAGVDNFSRLLVDFLKQKDTFIRFTKEEKLLEKIAIAIDSTLFYYLLTKGDKRATSINSELVDRFIEIYSANEKNMCRTS